MSFGKGFGYSLALGAPEVEDLQPAVVMLHHGGAALHPVPVVHIEDAVDLPHLGMMDVTADHPVHPTPPGFLGHSVFEVVDELEGVFHFQLQEGGEAPVAQAEPPPHAVPASVEGEEGAIAIVAEVGQPLGLIDDAVELVAMGDEVAFAVGGDVDRVPLHHHPAEVDAAEIPQPVVMVAGDVDDLHALSGHAQHLLHHVGVGLGPAPAAFQLPAVDDVADEIEGPRTPDP